MISAKYISKTIDDGKIVTWSMFSVIVISQQAVE